MFQLLCRALNTLRFLREFLHSLDTIDCSHLAGVRLLGNSCLAQSLCSGVLELRFCTPALLWLCLSYDLPCYPCSFGLQLTSKCRVLRLSGKLCPWIASFKEKALVLIEEASLFSILGGNTPT